MGEVPVQKNCRLEVSDKFYEASDSLIYKADYYPGVDRCIEIFSECEYNGCKYF